MPAKYEPLTTQLRSAADRGQRVVDMDFAQIADLVGGLPRSAGTSRQWWSNSSQTQALAWRAAGFHVDAVWLERRRVRFVAGEVGGTYADRVRQHPSRNTAPPTLASLSAAGATDVRVLAEWRVAGDVKLGPDDRPSFPRTSAVPGLYRLTLIGGSLARPLVYVGESTDLRRRMANYRNPGGSQMTNLRLNARLRDHLAVGGRVTLAIAIEATIVIGDPDAGPRTPLDLSRGFSRRLVENATLVQVEATGDVDIDNLP